MSDTSQAVIIVVFGGFLYFLPAWIGAKKQNATAIFLLNLFLGWSIIGWVVALVWATTKEVPQPRMVVQTLVAPVVPPPPLLPMEPQARVNRLRELRDSGTITQEEFMDLISRG